MLSEHPADQDVFNQAIAVLSEADGPAIAQTYDFSRFDRIVDVGGGLGNLARLIAEKTPKAKVTVFDLPHVIGGAPKRPSDEGWSCQIDFKSGGFLDFVPGPTGLCVVKHILHDWDDETAPQILANCRNALSDGGRVLICEIGFPTFRVWRAEGQVVVPFSTKRRSDLSTLGGEGRSNVVSEYVQNASQLRAEGSGATAGEIDATIPVPAAAC